MRTIDYKFQQLCEEIDYWKEQSEYYEEKYKTEMQINAGNINKQLKESKQGVANALMFALNIKDNKDGSLSISSKDRKQLAENYKP